MMLGMQFLLVALGGALSVKRVLNISSTANGTVQMEPTAPPYFWARAHPPETKVSRRVDDIADQVFQAALDDFRLHAENRKLEAEAAALEARIAAVRGEKHALLRAQQTPALRPGFLSAANRAAQSAAAKIAAAVGTSVLQPSDLTLAAKSAAKHVLAEGCDNAVQSAVLSAAKVTTETIGAEYAPGIAEKVRAAVTAECRSESEVVAQKAAEKAEEKIRGALPQIAQRVALEAATPLAMEMAAAAQDSWLAYMAKVNATLAAGGNISNMSLNMTMPTLGPTTTTVAPVLNATENVTENVTENITANVSELMNATSEEPVLMPPGAVEPVEVTIGNETVAADLPPTIPPPPPVPPRVEVAMATAVEAAKAHAAERVQEVILPHNKGAWIQHFASEMQQLSLAGVR